MLPTDKISLGTTTIAFKYRDGILLCADTRTSSGTRIANYVSRKLIQLTDHIAVAVSGSAADTRYLSRVVREVISQHELQLGGRCAIRTVANLYSMFNHEYKERLLAGILVAGADEQGLHCFKCIPGGTFLEADWVMSGSGSTYIQGLMREHYRPDMDEAEAIALAKRLIKNAATSDGATSNLIRWMRIRADGVVDPDDDAYEALQV